MQFSAALGRVWGELARRLVEPAILPFSCVNYATAVSRYTEQLDEEYGKLMRQHGLNSQLGTFRYVNTFKRQLKTFLFAQAFKNIF